MLRLGRRLSRPGERVRALCAFVLVAIPACIVIGNGPSSPAPQQRDQARALTPERADLRRMRRRADP